MNIVENGEYDPQQSLPDPREERFAQAYIDCGYKAREAAVAVGVPESNAVRYSRSWLRDKHVLRRIQHLHAPALQLNQINAIRTLRELGKVAFADARDLFDHEGRLLPGHVLPDDIAATIAQAEDETTTMPDGTVRHIRRYRRYDKNYALGALAKHFKIIGEEGDGVNALASALADRLNAAARRMSEIPTLVPISEQVPDVLIPQYEPAVQSADCDLI